MVQHPIGQDLSRAQSITKRTFSYFSQFIHVESTSGIALLVAAVVALLWANSPFAASYHSLLHLPLSVGVDGYVFSQSVHFWINDGLMAVFFLVVGMEIRREIHEGALSSIRVAALPLAAALGGVVVPAMIYFFLNGNSIQRQGWAVPTATDIAFAVGVLALLGSSIPRNVRIFLLAVAIIDDVVAVVIIAAFYSGGLDYNGLLTIAVGVLMILGLQRIGIDSAFAYVIPGAILWGGLLQLGAHPTLAGVVLGMMTPVAPVIAREYHLRAAAQSLNGIITRSSGASPEVLSLMEPVKQLRSSQLGLVPPVTRVQAALHPWVAYGVMPIFALANAGVTLGGVNLDADGARDVMLGVALALIFGKPAGIVAASWLVVRIGWCRLPSGVTWPSILLVGLLAGIGFTMSIFIATLAFGSENLLGAAKLGVLLGSLASATLGLVWGWLYIRRMRSRA